MKIPCCTLFYSFPPPHYKFSSEEKINLSLVRFLFFFVCLWLSQGVAGLAILLPKQAELISDVGLSVMLICVVGHHSINLHPLGISQGLISP